MTFGQRYRTEDHPTFLPAHPDGYVVIDVPDDRYAHAEAGGNEVAAREAAFALLGSQWSHLYPLSEMDAMQLDGVSMTAMFPRGQLGLIQSMHGHWVFVEPHAVIDEYGDRHDCWCDHDGPHNTEAREASRQRWMSGPLTDPPYGEGP